VIVSRPRQVTAGSSPVLRAINVDVAADSCGNCGQVAVAGADDEVAAPEGPFDHAAQEQGTMTGPHRAVTSRLGDPGSPFVGFGDLIRGEVTALGLVLADRFQAGTGPG
jgi:hypothetical protein